MDPEHATCYAQTWNENLAITELQGEFGLADHGLYDYKEWIRHNDQSTSSSSVSGYMKCIHGLEFLKAFPIPIQTSRDCFSTHRRSKKSFNTNSDLQYDPTLKDSIPRSVCKTLRHKLMLIMVADGGGIRGLSSLYVLRNLMDDISALEKRDNIQPYEFFDLIVGTSTGGYDHFRFWQTVYSLILQA